MESKIITIAGVIASVSAAVAPLIADLGDRGKLVAAIVTIVGVAAAAFGKSLLAPSV